MTTTCRTEKGRIASGGAGGFLNPPTHPEHTLHVETGPRRNPDSFSSLSYAVTCEWLDTETREKARQILAGWDRPAIDSAEVKDWVHQVLGYFRGCYVGQDKAGNPSWSADSLRIDPKADPVLNADIHAGVHFIRKYYPEFTPTAEDFGGAYWGTKPE